MQQGIQRLDFVPILDFHYRLLAKSKYDIDNRYSVVFDAIDTPSEKDIAEIREITSRCDLNYIQAGVISPEEVRGVLREDINSGYNALTEEIEEQEQDPFEGIGGSGNSAKPF